MKRPAREKPDLKLRNQNSELFIVKLPKRSMEFLKYKNKTAEFKANPLVVGTLTTCEDPSDGPAFLKFSESTKSKCEHELSDLQFTFTRREHAERVFFVSRNKEQKCAVQGYVKGQFRGQRSFGVGMLRKTSVKDAGASSLKFVEDGDVTETQNNVLMFNEEIPAMKLNRKDAEGSGVNTYPKSGTRGWRCPRHQHDCIPSSGRTAGPTSHRMQASRRYQHQRCDPTEQPVPCGRCGTRDASVHPPTRHIGPCCHSGLQWII